jgi:CRP-like cAMP-binding protein
VIRAGDEGDTFYLVRAGRLEVLSPEGLALARLSRGDYFGEAALLRRETRNATVRALTAGELLCLSKYQFDRLIRQNATFDAAAGQDLERLRVLRCIPLFAEFDCRNLRQLAAKLDRLEVQAGEVVFRQGEPGDSFYILECGKVSVQIESVERATLGPGEYFGEIALMTAAPRSASIVAVQPTTLLRLRAPDFAVMLRDCGALKSAMERASSRRLLSNERWMQLQAASRA